MKFAKILALLLCFALFAGVTAGCNKTPEEIDPDPELIADENDPADETPDDPENINEDVKEFRELTAAELMSEMGAGWNIGNTLDGGHGRRGVTPEQQERAWGNPQTTPEMIDLLVDTGFRTLRVPVTWYGFMGDAPDFIIEEVFMDRVQEVVDYGIDRGLYVILNMHHENWLYPSEENYEEAKAKLTAAWTQIGDRFSGYCEKLIFEGMNEPRLKGHADEWNGGTEEARDVINRWNFAFVEAVRALGGNNDKRWLMVTTHAAASYEPQITDFIMPDGDNLIVSIHQYLPHRLALDPRSSMDEFDPENEQHTRDIDSMFERLDNRFISQGIFVVMGEMGCINKDNLEARVAATRYYAEAAAALGISCLWWDNGIKERNPDRRDEEAFGIMDRRAAEWWFPEIAEALVEVYG